MTPNLDSRQPFLDRFGVTLSFLCILHCVGLPLIVMALPAMAWVESHVFHAVVLALALPVAILALASGYRRHRDFVPVVLGAAGSGLLAAGLVPVAAAWQPAFETALTLAGGGLLIAAHWRNLRHSRCATTRRSFLGLTLPRGARSLAPSPVE